jgi:hypothetical protein
MIKKLYECGCFKYEKFILVHQKELLLTPASSVVLIQMLKEYETNKYFSVQSLKSKMMISDKEFDEAVANLLEREFYSIYIQYEDGIGREAVSLDGFFDRVKDILSGVNSKDFENDFFYVTQLIQKEIGRVLTADELSIVSSLITEDRVKVSDIEEALEYMKSRYKVLNIKNLVTSLNRFRNEVQEEEEPVPDFVKNFLDNIK